MNFTALWATIACFVLFFVATLFIISDTLVQILSAGIFVAASVGILRWGPAAFRVYFPSKTAPHPDKSTSIGILGLVLWLLSEAGKRVYAVWVIQLHRPDWISEIPISAGLNAMTLAGLCLVVLATRWPGERPSNLSGLTTAMVAFIALFLTSLGPFLLAKMGALGAFLARVLMPLFH